MYNDSTEPNTLTTERVYHIHYNERELYELYKELNELYKELYPERKNEQAHV
jgi:hypothetical protein